MQEESEKERKKRKCGKELNGLQHKQHGFTILSPHRAQEKIINKKEVK